MKRKSLYLRIVKTFVGVVLISTILSFVITTTIFHENLGFQDEVRKAARGVSAVAELLDHDEIDTLMEAVVDNKFSIRLYSANGESKQYGIYSFDVDEATLNSVLGGQESEPTFNRKLQTSIVGIPITINNEPYALFVLFDFREQFITLQHMLLLSLGLVLVFGSIQFLFASQYIVQPIKKLTVAAKEMAAGNFKFRLKSHNKDEVGDLIDSFNYMASEVEKIDKVREEFVSNVSHEIQSPLTSIRGFAKAIKDDVVPKQNQKEYLEIIYQETERLSRLSDNLLRLASLDSEHHPFYPSTYRLDEQIRRTVLATEPQWKSKSLTISLELAPLKVYADQDLLEQVWLNLITNAIKYSHNNGEIEIELMSKNSEALVSIKDYGKGIPEKEIPQLFERFFKVDKARSSKVEGSGLGLSIVKKILSIHNCRVEVLSAEEKGSIFTVSIPDSREAARNYQP